MRRFNRTTLLVPVCLVSFFIGCNRAEKSAEPKGAPTANVLTVGDDANTIINKAIKAHGGDEAFSRWTCGYLKYTTKGGLIPPQVEDSTVEDTFQLPGHFKRVAHSKTGPGDVVMIFVINHRKGWKKLGEAEATPMDNDFSEQKMHPFGNFCNLLTLKEGESRLSNLGESRIESQAALGVRSESETIGQAEYFFRMDTGLLFKSKKLAPGPDAGKTSVMESYLDDYKDIQGAKVPMQIKSMQDGKLILDVTLVSVKFESKFDESVFAKP